MLSTLHSFLSKKFFTATIIRSKNNRKLHW